MGFTIWAQAGWPAQGCYCTLFMVVSACSAGLAAPSQMGGKGIVQAVHLLMDAMGGDMAPQAPVLGSLAALRKDPHLEITLAGVREAI